METIKKMMCMTLGAGFCLASCTSMDEGLNIPVETKQGELVLSLFSGTEFKDETRSVNESLYKNVNNYTVQVFDKDGTEKLNCKGSELATKMPLTLNIGACSVKAWYGQQEAASRDVFYVEGVWASTIKANQKEQINIECTPTCGRITVEFGPEMATYFTNYDVDFFGTRALAGKSISWAENDTEPWYIQLDEAGEAVSFSITTVTKDEYVNAANKDQTYTRTGSFHLSRNKGYKMIVNPSYTPLGGGQVSLDITIDESVNSHEEDIEVPITWI